MDSSSAFKIFGNGQVHLILIVILTETKRTWIRIAMPGINHNSGAAHGSGRIVTLEHQIPRIRFIVSFIPQKTALEFQAQRAAAPGCRAEQRILGKTQVIRHTVRIMEINCNRIGRIMEGIRRLLGHFQLDIGMPAVADHLQPEITLLSMDPPTVAISLEYTRRPEARL